MNAKIRIVQGKLLCILVRDTGSEDESCSHTSYAGGDP